MQTNELLAQGVYIIRSADAAIKPDDNKIIIRPGANMDTIEGAKILFNTTSKLHLLYDARVHIASKKLYSANGYLKYKDEDKKETPIFFKEVTSATGYSVGYADISKQEPLNLSDAFKFYGEVGVTAQDSAFMFDGGVSLALECTGKESPYLRFKAKIDATNIEIPISEAPVDVEGNRITTSILFNERNLEPVVAFFTSDKEADNVFLKAQGYLTFDKQSKEYRIANREKLQDFTSVTGDYLVINRDNCRAKGLGNIKIGLPIGSVIESNNYGEIKTDNSSKATTIKMSLALNFPFSEEALDIMGANLYDDMNLEQLDIENSRYKEYLPYIFGIEQGEEYLIDLISNNEWEKIPKQMAYTLFLPDVNLQWDEIRNCYLSTGDISIGIVGKHQINKKIKSRIQLIKTGVATEIRIYLEQDMDNWYYFAYNGASMSVVSSDDNFNEAVKNAKKKEFKGENGKVYTFRLVSENEKRNFIRNIELSE